MKTVRIRCYGGPEVLEISAVPEPWPGRGQIRIHVEAATVNPVDLATRSGALADAGLMATDEPVVLGWDAAGVVDAIGDDVSALRLGDRVIAIRDLLTAPSGAQADAIVLDADAVAPAPVSWTPVEAATLPLNGLTALQALDTLALPSGTWLAVTGPVGAVGGYALELASVYGLHTVAVARPEHEPATRELGADAFVSTDAGNLGQAVRAVVPGGVDGALDAAALGAPILDAVRNGGRFAAVSPGAAPPGLRGIDVQTVWIRGDATQLEQLSQLADAGVLTARVEDVLALDDVARAHERLAAGGLNGRIVLAPRS